MPPTDPCTPYRPSRALTSDSPVTVKHMQTAKADLGTEGQRKLALRDLQEAVPQVPTEVFFDANGLLPPLPKDIDLQQTLRNLQGGDSPLDSRGRWKGISQRSEFVGKKEDDVYAILPDIVRRIIDASGVDTSRVSLTFECNPTGVPFSTTRDNNSKPDCVGRLASAPEEYSKREWIDIAVPGEFKKQDDVDSLIDDCTKLLWSFTHILREDPRRRRVFGFTIEGWNMRLWFASRSDVLVSYTLNINTHHAKFVEFFLRLACADRWQLGWDETMRRVMPTDPKMSIQYDIDLQDKTYRTVRLLSNVGAEALRGRGTRVWEVRELSNDGKEVGPILVLKDSWVDATRMREGDILKEIRKDAKQKGGNCEDTLDRVLVNTVTYGDVLFQGKPDDTFTETNRDRILDKIDIVLKVKADPSAYKKLTSSLPVTGALNVPQEKEQRHVRYGPKVHHRTVFTEVGKRLDQLTSLSDVFWHLSKVIIGLGAMHACGWVHRDISIGNILVVGNSVKITDVEYARREDAETQHGVRTGTLAFMSPEVEYSKYMYEKSTTLGLPAPDDATSIQSQTFYMGFDDDAKSYSEPGDSDSDSSSNSDSDSSDKHDADSSTSRLFKNNPLHDLESGLWVSLWGLLCSNFAKNDPTMTHQQWDDYILKNGRFAASLFCDSVFRRDVMTLGPSTFCDGLAELLPQVRTIGLALDKFRQLLITCYKTAEERLGEPGYTIPFTVAEPLYPDLVKILRGISHDLRKKDLTVIVKEQDPVPVRIVKRAIKNRSTKPEATTTRNKARAADDDDDDDEDAKRPAKSLKTHAARSAGMSSAPSLLARTRHTRSRTATSSKPSGSTSRSTRR